MYSMFDCMYSMYHSMLCSMSLQMVAYAMTRWRVPLGTMLIGSGARELLETKPWMTRIGCGFEKLCLLWPLGWGEEGLKRASPNERNFVTPCTILVIQDFVSSNSRAPDPMSMVPRGTRHRVTVFRVIF